MNWSCGNSKQIRQGDRLFLFKQGDPPRGVIGSGWALSEMFEGLHWDLEKRKRGIPGYFVAMRFDALLEPRRQAILEIAQLTRPPLSEVHWASQASGIRIPDRAVPVLERVWRAHLHALRIPAAAAANVGEDEPEYGGAADEASLLSRITADVRIFGGKPVIRGQRLAVEHVLGLLAAGETIESVLDNYPWLERADVQACLAYARRLVARERIEPLEAGTQS